MNAIQNILPAAIKAVEDMVLVEKKVPKEFNGYISSFGASVITSGLLPTIVFFSQEGKGKGNRTSVILALEQILKEKSPGLLANERLIEKVKTMVVKNEDMQHLQEKIMEAAIALKLAIRIFPKSDKK